MTDTRTNSPIGTRRWAPWTGATAAIIGAAATMLSSTPVAVDDRRADPASAVVQAYDGLTITLKAASGLGLLGAGLLVVFMAVLREWLEAHHPPGSAIPAIAWAGGLVAGAALTVAFIVSAIAATLIDEGYRDTTLEAFGALADNLAFAAWTPLGLSMAALAASGLRLGGTPRWIGAVSTATTVVLVLALAVGLPFAAWVIAFAWLLVTSAAVARSDTR